MRDHFVIDPLIGKRQQLLLATQLCRMVLKVCEHFTPMQKERGHGILITFDELTSLSLGK